MQKYVILTFTTYQLMQMVTGVSGRLILAVQPHVAVVFKLDQENATTLHQVLEGVLVLEISKKCSTVTNKLYALLKVLFTC
jgi:hypothetical protein